MKEIWRVIKIDGEKTCYRISNFGRLYNKKLDRYYDVTPTKKGYKFVSIRHKGKEYKFGIHRLVAMYFCKIPKRHLKKGLTFNDLVPNHTNGIKDCNASFNLEWVTPKENSDHAWREGLCDGIRGENSHLAKITEETAKLIIEGIMQKKSSKTIAKELNVSKKTVQHIRSKECWKHLTKDLEFPKVKEDVRYTISEDTIHNICNLLELKKYKDTEIAKMCNVRREYVKDIRTHRRRKKISALYNF